MTLPPLPLPELISCADETTFASFSLRQRVPEIGRRIIAENNFPPRALQAMRALIAEIPARPIRPIQDPAAPDAAAWAEYVEPYAGQIWDVLPFYFAEAYFYRRVIEAVGYFAPGPEFGRDPYTTQKRAGLDSMRGPIRQLTRALARLSAGQLAQAIELNLWGNRADLSMWPVRPGEDGPDLLAQAASESIVCNDLPRIAAHLRARPGGRVDFILDNTGFELAADLALVDFLFTHGFATRVQLNAKAHPTFVSDALIENIIETIQWLAADEDADCQALASRLRARLETGQLTLSSHFFWNAPLMFSDLPADLRADLRDSTLVISKGDANYRRLLGDRQWSPTAPFAQIVNGFPAPLAALRISKSECQAGLAPGLAERLAAQDPMWMTNGQWGMIQFAE